VTKINIKQAFRRRKNSKYLFKFLAGWCSKVVFLWNWIKGNFVNGKPPRGEGKWSPGVPGGF
jgi:hypothetical protein